ncbi:MAG: pyridoxal-phosphate dependent enzyme [Pseudomonadales bacterium]|nr:pyridoxal-phosphate dependent enzyme [Pseudomonadales bacterium]
MIYSNILGAIGNTPIVKLNRVTRNVDAEIYAKLEFMNPGGSIKDRIGYWLIEDAEKRGVLKPGGTIIEGTSGNTGVGLAIAAAIKGYQCIFVLPDKMSDEKIMNLRAFGAKVVVTPTAVEPDDPKSYYSVSKRLAKETPNSFYIDQYNNLANRDCHYQNTGPEILAQFPDMDVFIAGIGTGGTICGNGKYFKEHKPEVEIVAVDPIGSIVYDKFKTGKDVPAETYMIEGIGEDFIPNNYDFDVIDDMVQVEDKESFLMTRELLVKEGIYSGVSSGSVVVGAMKWIKAQGDRLKGKKVLVMLPDSGNRYLTKVYDDAWMREAGFIEEPSMGTVQDLIFTLQIDPSGILIADTSDKVSKVIDLMKEKGISQVPVSDTNGYVKGLITETAILNALYEGEIQSGDEILRLVDSSVEFVNQDDSIEKISHLVSSGMTPLVLDAVTGQPTAVLTKIDLLSYLSQRR